MTIGAFIPTIAQNRTLNNDFKNSSYYSQPTYFKFGVGSTQLTESSTNLTTVIPILNGTVCDNGDNTFTGSSGGDNTTDNTTTYKAGAGVTDNHSQNLIANATNATKIWTNADLAAAGVNADATKYVGCWLYIKDAATKAKFLTAGTAIELRLGADSTTNYYSQVWTASQLAVGWNWLSNNSLLSTWTVAGTPGVLNDFQIRITTNNATDTFVAGDVLFDLLRQWVITDVKSLITTGYPLVNTSEVYVEILGRLEKTEAVGFDITQFGLFNAADEPMIFVQLSTAGESKSSADIFIPRVIEKLRNRRLTL
jgi:hypothetical protein